MSAQPNLRDGPLEKTDAVANLTNLTRLLVVGSQLTEKQVRLQTAPTNIKEGTRTLETSPTYFKGKRQSDKVFLQELPSVRGFDLGDFFGCALC